MNQPKSIFAILVVQIVCAVILIGKILAGGLATPLTLASWIEIGAVFGLFLGVFLGAVHLRDSLARTEAAEDRLAALSGPFMDLVHSQFEEWSLTKAERDVAFCLLKGLSAAEIAGLRSTSEGTIKAQSNSIYRKAGVANRAQLVSLFIEDLILEDGVLQSQE